MARLSPPLPEITCRCIVRILQNACGAQQAAAMVYVFQSLSFYASCLNMVSRKMNFSAGSCPQREEKMGRRIIQGGRRRLIFPCESFLSSSS